MTRRAPSLVDLCVQVAIDNVRYIGNVGETEHHLLERILSHCTLDQLKHIEDRTVDRDLSPVTDKFWKEHYKRQFSVGNTNDVIRRMTENNVTYKWKELFEAKSKDLELAQQKTRDQLRKLYQNEDAKRKSRQVQPCAKVPPSSKRRSYSGGAVANNIYNTKSGIMKKAKLDFVNSREVQNVAAMKNKVVHKNYRSVSSSGKNSNSSGIASSSSKQAFPSPQCFSSVSSEGKKSNSSGVASSSSKPALPIRKRF